MFFKRVHSNGFSMVELSISLAILGVLLSGSLLVATLLIEETALEDTVERIDKVNESLKAFVQVHGRLPCPAPPERTPGQTFYGQEFFSLIGTERCDRSRFGMAYDSASAVSVGTIPVRRMGLPDKYMADAYGNRFIYAVSEPLTITASFVATTNDLGVQDIYTGNVGIQNRGGSMAYAIISTGKDGQGSYRYKSGQANANCDADANQLDIENCDEDAVFTDVRYNDGEIANNYFDDIIRYTPKFILTQLSLNGIDGLCTTDNVDIMRYEEDSQRFYSCFATDVNNGPAVWRLLSVIDTATNPVAVKCAAHHRGLVRKTPTDVSTGDLQYCSATGDWENITFP